MIQEELTLLKEEKNFIMKEVVNNMKSIFNTEEANKFNRERDELAKGC